MVAVVNIDGAKQEVIRDGAHINFCKLICVSNYNILEDKRCSVRIVSLIDCHIYLLNFKCTLGLTLALLAKALPNFELIEAS